MEDIWTIFCGESDCSYGGGKQCPSAFMFFTHPSSCINNVLVLAFDVLLLLMLLFNFIHKPTPEMLQMPSRFQGLLPSQIFSAIFNGGLGMAYFSYGIWTLQENLRMVQTILPLHQWLVLLFQGFTWLLLALIISLRGKQLPKAFLRLWSTLASLCAGILCFFSLFTATLGKQASVRIVLDVLSLPGAVLLLLCSHRVYKYDETGDAISSAAIYTPLNGQAKVSGKTDFDSNVTPFADAGFFSKMSFWWLNRLVRKGQEKTLEEEDIPRLCESDSRGATGLGFGGF